MPNYISTDVRRVIIYKYAEDIKKSATGGVNPEKAVIDFRNDRQRGKAGERDVVFVKTSYLRFRRDNGRIVSDVMSYEKLNEPILDNREESQSILKNFLENLDKENNEKLKNSIKHSGQIEPAIITCDGFLINGNRRKMILEELVKETYDKKYEMMKVVILPGEDDEGGPPTIIEIEEIENRYQQQRDGKSDYTNFNWALSTQRKIIDGYSLERQLKDDSNFANLPQKEFQRKVEEIKEGFLYPLQAVTRYLDSLGRELLYNTITEGRGDREGRWYAFIDYYKYVYKKLIDEKSRIKLEVEEVEIGDIEDVAFKIIRQKDFRGFLKTHMVMRKIPDILKNREAKKELMKIANNTVDLTKSEIENCKGDIKLIDGRWANNNGTLIIGRVKKAVQTIEHEKDIETPFTLLEDSLKKLNHENMKPISLDPTKRKPAIELTKEIQSRANELEKEFWNIEKGSEKFKIVKNK